MIHHCTWEGAKSEVIETNGIRVYGGEGGIRTRDTLADIPVFETGAFNHSATSPEANTRPFSGLSDPLANLLPILLSFEGELFEPFYHSFGRQDGQNVAVESPLSRCWHASAARSPPLSESRPLTPMLDSQAVGKSDDLYRLSLCLLYPRWDRAPFRPGLRRDETSRAVTLSPSVPSS